MTRTTTAVPPARATAVCRPATRPRPVRYADAVGRIVAGGQPAPARRTTRRGGSAGRSTADAGAVDRTVAASGAGARLTRRGRVVVVLLVALLLTVGFSLGRVSRGPGPEAATARPTAPPWAVDRPALPPRLLATRAVAG